MTVLAWIIFILWDLFFWIAPNNPATWILGAALIAAISVWLFYAVLCEWRRGCVRAAK